LTRGSNALLLCVVDAGEGVTEWEAAEEREEFARAAQMYRPLTSVMASRFTRAQLNDDEKGDDKAGLQVDSPGVFVCSCCEGGGFSVFPPLVCPSVC